LTIGLDLPTLRHDQYQIAIHPAKKKTLAMGRRWGKTVLGGVLTLNTLRQHGRVAWIVPEYKNGRALWRYASSVCAPLAQARLMDVSKSERAITTHGGGFLGIYSADNIDSIRSEAFNLVVRDEAARQSEEGLQDAVIPTLADGDGSLVDISTPLGKNYYFYDFMAGKQAMDGERASWNAPTSANPSDNIRRAYANVKKLVEAGRYSSRAFRQEWQAEFVDDGAFFVNIDKCATAETEEAKAGREYVIGVDWARSSGGDATVFVVLDVMGKQMVSIRRMQGEPFDVQLNRLRDLHKRYNNAPIIAEYNSMGGPLVERLQTEQLPVTPFVTTLASKHEIVTALDLAFENLELKILNDTVLVTELNAYEKKDRAGVPSYSAPEGMHDDTVIALCLAWWAGVASQSWYMI
jgi:hypothetical protein